MAYFHKGSKIHVVGGGEAEVISDEPLGEGGQGEVYKVKYNGQEYALKWYTNNRILNDDEFKENLRSNIVSGPIGGSFVWPLHLVEEKDRYGYIMDLIPPNYVSMVDILNKCKKKLSSDGKSVLSTPVGFKSLETMFVASINIINSFKLLHRSGYCYKDLNDGGLYFDVETGNVLVCDCDNVAPDGKGSSIGKPGYMAPELVTHSGKSCINTDKHSLAVILYKLLFKDDPLKGKRVYEKVTLTGAVELEVYGNNPLFVMDPNDTSNGPVRGINDNVLKFWNLYPESIRNEFIQTFGPGLKDSNRRTIPQQWFIVMSKSLSEMISCPCGRPTRFLEEEQHENSSFTCPRCGLTSPIFNVGGIDMVMCKGANIRKYQSVADNDDPIITGSIVENKVKSGMYGIKNESNETWIANYIDGRQKIIAPGSGTILSGDLILDFGNGLIAKRKE